MFNDMFVSSTQHPNQVSLFLPEVWQFLLPQLYWTCKPNSDRIQLLHGTWLASQQPRSNHSHLTISENHLQICYNDEIF